MAAGSIIVDLLCRTASFESDSARAGKSLKKFQKDAEAAGKAIAVAFTGAVAGLAAIVKSSIDSADHLNDLSKKTGIAVETLGGIGFAAEQAGGDLDSAALAAGKLNKSLAAAAAGNKEAGEAFKLLGINVKDAAGNTKLADVALVELADKFAAAEDGPEKTALALRIFGKAGADMIPLLNDGGAALLANIEYFKRYSGVTQETAKAADEFNDAQTKVKLLSQAFGNQLAAATLPLMQTLADRFLAAKEQGDGFKGTAEAIVSIMKGLVVAGAYVIDTFGGVGREIGAIAAQIKLLDDAASSGRSLTDPFGTRAAAKAFNSEAYTAISDAVKADGERAKKDLDAFVKQVQNPSFQGTQNAFSDARFDASNKPKKPLPRLSGGGAGADTASQELKKRLDGELRLIQDFARSQADAYAVGNAYLDGVYEDGLVSQREFFSTQKNIRDAGLRSTLEAIDKEITAQRRFIADPKSSKTDRVGAEEKIKLAVQQRADAITKASASDILANQADARSAQQLAESYGALKAQVLSASGDEFGAAQIRNAQAVAQARKLITQAGGDPAVADNLERMLSAQTAFTRASEESSIVTSRLQIAEERIALARANGSISELDALEKVGEARRASVAQLEAMVVAQEAVARASGNPALILNAERARLELEKLKESLDPLKEKFDNMFKDAGSSALGDFLNRTKSAKEAAKDFVKTITTDLNNQAARAISEQVFGKDGILGGLGGAFAGVFGKKKDPLQIQTAGVEASLANLAATGIDPTTAALARLQQAADSAAGAFGKQQPAATGGGFGSVDPAAAFGGGAPGDIKTTGDFARFDRKTSGEESIADLFKEPAKGAADLGESFVSVRTNADILADFIPITVAGLGALTGAGRGAGAALALLPSIVQAFAASTSVSSGSGGGGGGIWGTVFSAVAGYFGGGSGLSIDTSGYSANAGIGYSNAAGISGGRADGGPVLPGQSYMVGERGPERLVMGNQGGTVIPNHALGSRPISVTQNFSVSGPANRDTQTQIAASAARGIQRAMQRNT